MVMRDLSDCPDGSASVFRDEGGPTHSVRCAAGDLHRPARAMARHRCLNRAQPTGRASGVNCTQCWAAGAEKRWNDVWKYTAFSLVQKLVNAVRNIPLLLWHKTRERYQTRTKSSISQRLAEYYNELGNHG